MTTMNPLLDIDAKPTVGSSALRPRAGNNGRQFGKMPEMFPEVLADLTLSKNAALEAVSALAPMEKSIIGNDEADTADTENDSPSEEKMLQPTISADVKQYLQNFAVIAHKQTGGGESVSPQASVAELLSTVAAKIELGNANGKQADDDGPDGAPENVENSGMPGFHELKFNNPRESGDNDGKNSQILSRFLEMKSTSLRELDDNNVGAPQIPSSELSKAEHLPERKEVYQTKPTDVEVRVMKVETSFLPAASPSFVTQFAKMITDSLDGPVHGPFLIVDSPVPDPRHDVVRSIQIQLHPDDLGKIKVAMHLRGDELRLQIEVTSRKVEVLLLNDHQVLKDLLGQAGYDIKDASISITLNPNDLNPPQRSIAVNEPSHESLVGQGSRQHPGAGEENQNQFQKARGPYASASEFESGQEANLPTTGSGRGSGVFV